MKGKLIIAFTLLVNTIEVNLYPVTLKESWGIDEVFKANAAILKFRGHWISGSEFIYQVAFPNGTEYVAYEVNTQTARTFVRSELLKSYKNALFTLSSDKKKFLIAYDRETIFRHSSKARYDVLDIATEKVYKVAAGNLTQYAEFSPNGNRVAYVMDNNLYVSDIDGPTRQITADGEEQKIYNGIPDWVYEEEVFSAASALWWSPDSEKIAFAKFIDDKVEMFKYFIYGEPTNLDSQYPKEIDIRYPKPGTPNPNVSLYIVNIKDFSEYSELVQMPAPIHIVSDDHILKEVSWSSGNDIVVLWQNRRQNRGVILKCDIKTAFCKEVRAISELNGWIMTKDIDCSAGDNTCQMIDWNGNWMQIYHLDLKNGNNLNGRPFGKNTILKIYGRVDKHWYYQATDEENPAFTHVYRNEECLSCNIPDPCTSASASFSVDFKYVALSCDGPNPTTVGIYSTENKNPIYEKSSGLELIKIWETNEAFRKNVLSKKLLPSIKYLKVKVAGDFDAVVKLYLPPYLDFDHPNPNDKYPLLIYVYSGPNSAKISSSFSIAWDTYVTTTRNIIYAEIEGRGTGNKGKDILYAVNNKLGTIEIEDQISVTKYLQQTYSFIDRQRTAIWGWSYGGYATAKALATDDEHIFQCGISVAPVTSWTYYDTIYTERYMGLPTWNDNLKGYNNGDLLLGDHRTIANFRKHDYLLMHGVADDNVHYQQSLQFSKILQRHNIYFEEMMYPDENHGINRLKPHLYRTMDHFLGQCLDLGK